MRLASVIGAATRPDLPCPLHSPGSDPVPVARRVQRSRRKGAPLPEGAVYVGRPTRWGNPFANKDRGHAKAVILHERWLTGRLGALTLERMGFDPGWIAALDRRRVWVMTHLHELAGRDLACWCSPGSKWCHAEILLRLAPEHAEYERFAA